MFGQLCLTIYSSILFTQAWPYFSLPKLYETSDDSSDRGEILGYPIPIFLFFFFWFLGIAGFELPDLLHYEAGTQPLDY